MLFNCYDDDKIDDIDPGKDIFALLFLSFFLINSVVLLCVSKQGEQSINVNTVNADKGKTIKASFLTGIELKNGKIFVSQNNISYVLPNDLNRFRKEAKFDTIYDEKGNKHLNLIVKDPGKTMTAGEMLNVVHLLNNADIGVDFRPVLN
ncbi:Biopolymer transport protein ExbD/TolR [Candidatus Magnetomoraceae bacterium gMMP-15]